MWIVAIKNKHDKMLRNLFVACVSAIGLSRAHVDGYWNWSENIQFTTTEIIKPKDAKELANLV